MVFGRNKSPSKLEAFYGYAISRVYVNHMAFKMLGQDLHTYIIDMLLIFLLHYDYILSEIQLQGIDFLKRVDILRLLVYILSSLSVMRWFGKSLE